MGYVKGHITESIFCFGFKQKYPLLYLYEYLGNCVDTNDISNRLVQTDYTVRS